MALTLLSHEYHYPYKLHDFEHEEVQSIQKIQCWRGKRAVETAIKLQRDSEWYSCLNDEINKRLYTTLVNNPWSCFTRRHLFQSHCPLFYSRRNVRKLIHVHPSRKVIAGCILATANATESKDGSWRVTDNRFLHLVDYIPFKNAPKANTTICLLPLLSGSELALVTIRSITPLEPLYLLPQHITRDTDATVSESRPSTG